MKDCMPMILPAHTSLASALGIGRVEMKGTHEKTTIAKTTNSATLCNNGLAVFKLLIIVVVPLVTVNSLAHLITLSALNTPTLNPPPSLSTPNLAIANATQKLTTAIKSTRDHEWRRYGRWRRVAERVLWMDR